MVLDGKEEDYKRRRRRSMGGNDREAGVQSCRGSTGRGGREREQSWGGEGGVNMVGWMR